MGSYQLQRRAFLVALGVASTALLAGCQLLRPQSTLELALSDLQFAIDSVEGSDADQAYRLANEVAQDARSLLELHYRFLEQFNGDAADQSVDTDLLAGWVTEYDQQRLALRSALLDSQRRLRETIPPEYWPDIREAFARKGGAVTDPRAAR